MRTLVSRHTVKLSKHKVHIHTWMTFDLYHLEMMWCIVWERKLRLRENCRSSSKLDDLSYSPTLLHCSREWHRYLLEKMKKHHPLSLSLSLLVCSLITCSFSRHMKTQVSFSCYVTFSRRPSSWACVALVFLSLSLSLSLSLLLISTIIPSPRS